MKVYAIKDTGSAAIKVGIAKDEGARLSALQTAFPRKLSLVHSTDATNARLAERTAHYLMREKRLSGEWFDVSEEEAVAAIARAIEMIESPDWEPPWEVAAREEKERARATRALSRAERATGAVSITFRTSGDLKQALEARAEEEGRTLSNLIEHLLRQQISPPKPPPRSKRPRTD